MSRSFRAVATAAASALVLATSAGVANAQSEELGALSVDVVGSAAGSLLDEVGSAAILGSIANETGGVDLGSVGINDGAVAGGSIDTTGSLLDEPTSGPLAPVWSEIAPVLGSSGGGAIKVGSLGDVVGGSGSDVGTESLGPILVVGGIAAAIGAGIAFAPQIEQALADAGIELPPLP